jgi:phage-related protein
MQAKAYRAIALLSEMGPLLGLPHAKAVVGQRGLRELRVQLGSDAFRLFYFHYRDVVYVVTSGYVKKAQKLDVMEIQRAAKLMRAFLEASR